MKTAESNLKEAKKFITILADRNLRGWDPYDILNSKFIKKSSKRNYLILLTQLNRVFPINLRKILKIRKQYNSKSMALFLLAFINIDSVDCINTIEFLKKWLIENKSDEFSQYSLGFNFDIILRSYKSLRNSPSLIITLFAIYAFIEYYEMTKDDEILERIYSFHGLLENKVPQYKNSQILWYSYNFEKENEIYNATAKVGKYFALFFHISNDNNIRIKIEKILNYLKKNQRADGSWAYGRRISYTDGFHTAFVLEAIWYMLKIVNKKEYEEMYNHGLEHYINFLFRSDGQPLYFHPLYKPNDIRRYIIDTDIRDCAMAIVFFSKINNKILAQKVLNWTLKHMYDSNKGYFYYYTNRFWTNRIEYIRWQAWMAYALSVYLKTFSSQTQ